jgi:ferredoxin
MSATPAVGQSTLEVVVDRDICEGHGQCEFAAPDVFTIDDEGAVQYVEHPPEAARSGVTNAVRLCPVQAIRIRA